jgi:hypothetical protein
MILLKLASSEAANGKSMSALRFAVCPQAARVFTWPLLLNLAIRYHPWIDFNWGFGEEAIRMGGLRFWEH